MRRAGVEYVVIKNSLALRAVNESGLAGTRLRGPTGIVVSRHPVEAAKVLADFAKENDQRPTIKGGLLDGASLSEAQVKKLATMPSREQLLTELGGGLMAPLAAFAGTMGGLFYMMVGALEALRAQKEGAA